MLLSHCHVSPQLISQHSSYVLNLIRATLKIGSQITIQIKQRPLESFKICSHHHEEAGTKFIDNENPVKQLKANAAK